MSTERLLDVYRSPELKYQVWPSLPEILNSNKRRSPDFYGWQVLKPQNLKVQMISLRSFPKILGVHMYCFFILLYRVPDPLWIHTRVECVECAAVRCSTMQCIAATREECFMSLLRMLQCVEASCRLLQRVAATPKEDFMSLLLNTCPLIHIWIVYTHTCT